MTLIAHPPTQEARPPAAERTGGAFDEACKALLRAWHDYEVFKALGAPLEAVSDAHRSLQRARAEVARCRPASSR